MVNNLLANLSFSPPAWPVTLAVVGWLLLAGEAACLWVRLRQSRGKLRASLLCVLALLAGPVLFLAGLMQITSSIEAKIPKGSTEMGESASESQKVIHRPRFKEISLIAAGLWGFFIVGLAVFILSYPCEGGILSIGFCASAWAIRTYRRTTAPISGRARTILLALRILLILLLTAWALRPILLHTRTETIRSILLIGVDTSASMQQKDMPPNYRLGQLRDDDEPISRSSAAGRALWAESELLEKINQNAELQCFAFASLADSARKYDTQNPSFWQDLIAESGVNKSSTAIGDSMQQAFDAFAASGRDILGMVILSDGCNNSADNVQPEKFASRLAGRNVPVHTVCVGVHKSSEGVRALNITGIGAEQNVQAFSKMNIKPNIETMGLKNRIVRITCKFGDEVIGQTSREIDLSPENFSPVFSHMPLKPGFHRLTVSAEVVGRPIRSLAGKHIADMLVHVSDKEIRLLYVEGKFRYETKYIVRSLAASERFSVHNFLMLRPLQTDSQPPLGETLDEWLRYHAIIFGDVPAKYFTPKQLEIIKRLVGEYGKGFCMIGGLESFGAGKWAGTPIADILPVSPASSIGQIDRLIKPLPTRAGENAPLMQIGPPDMSAKQAWAMLDPLPGANKFGGIKPAATVLAETDRHEPMIVMQQYGKGRSLAIAFDTTWRWALSPNLKGKAGQEMLQRFWRQVGLYLADPKGNVWIHTNRMKYDTADLTRGSEEIIITAGVEDSQGRPVRNPKYEVTLTDPAGKTRPIILAREGKVLKNTLLPPKTAGVYTLRITAELAERKMAAEQQFEIVLRNTETADVLADFQQLKRISAAGEGQCAQLNELSDLLEIIRTENKPRTREVTDIEDILGRFRWLVFVILIALLCAEWSLRKRKGLV